MLPTPCFRISSLLVCAAVVGGCSNAPPAELVELANRARPLLARLAEIYAKLPPSSYVARPCTGKLHPLRMTYSDLATASGKQLAAQAASQAASQAGLDPMNRHRFVWQPVDELSKPGEKVNWASNQARLRTMHDALSAARELRVGVVTERVEPTLEDDLKSFTPGRAEAWVLTFTLASGELVCSETVTARSSPSLSVRRFSQRATGEDELRHDLDRALERALEALEAKAGPGVVVR